MVMKKQVKLKLSYQYCNTKCSLDSPTFVCVYHKIILCVSPLTCEGPAAHAAPRKKFMRMRAFESTIMPLLLICCTRMLWHWPFHPTYSFLTTEVHVNVFTIHGHTVCYSYIVSQVREVHCFSCFDCLVEVGESIDKRTPLWHHNLALSTRSWCQSL